MIEVSAVAVVDGATVVTGPPAIDASSLAGRLKGDPLPPAGTAVRGAVEDERRTALMRTHSGLHVLCGVVFRDFGALVTGGNMQPGEARMDFNLPDLPEGFKAKVEDAVNAEVTADRAVQIQVLPREEALAIPDIIRTQTNLIPPEETEVRIVDITGLDADVRPWMTVPLTVHRSDGGSEQAPLLCRIDTLDEMDYYRSGGILQFVLNKLSGDV